MAKHFKMAKLNNSARNTYESLSPITWLLKIFAINCNVENESYSQVLYLIKTLLALFFIGALDIFCLYLKVIYIFDTILPSIKLTDSVQMVFDHFQFTVDLWFIYKLGRHISVEYFKQYEFIDATLGMTDYITIKRKLAGLLCFFTSIWIITSVIDFAAWTKGYGWKTPLIYSVAYVYLYVKILTTLDLTSHIMHIEMRLTMMADLIQNYYAAAENMPGFIRDTILNKNWYCPKAYSRALELDSNGKSFKISSKEEFDELQSLKRCYLQLTDQVEFINCMFGFRILLNSLSLLIDIVRFTNIAVRIIVGSQKSAYGAGYWPAGSNILRMLTCVAVLISLVHHCERAYSQKDRIITTIDHLLVNKNPSEKLRTAMVELRSLVLARPITFNAGKFFRLDCSFLASIASVSVTYTIILLQSMN